MHKKEYEYIQIPQTYINLLKYFATNTSSELAIIQTSKLFTATKVNITGLTMHMLIHHTSFCYIYQSSCCMHGDGSGITEATVTINFGTLGGTFIHRPIVHYHWGMQHIHILLYNYIKHFISYMFLCFSFTCMSVYTF